MAKPRVFVSSTFYDLKHVRSSLEIFIQSLGFEPVLSEKGDVEYTSEAPLDESRSREVNNCDVYVLILGGRYGLEVGQGKTAASKQLLERYKDLTRQEYKSASDRDIPVYVLIEKGVYAEYQTFRKNRDNKNINYAHVDAVDIFFFLEEIVAQPRNSPIYAFDNHLDIEGWLKDQWASLFRELIQRMSGQQQLASLTAQVSELAEINTTLKRYLEALLASEAPEKSKALIDSEAKRLEETRQLIELRKNPLVDYLAAFRIDLATVAFAIREAKTFTDFLQILTERSELSKTRKLDLWELASLGKPFDDVNDARRSLGLPAFRRIEDDETLKGDQILPLDMPTIPKRIRRKRV